MILSSILSKFRSSSKGDSRLYDQNSFYKAFMRDMKRAQSEVIIESPFISAYRMEKLFPVFKKLLKKGVSVHILTRDSAEHDEYNGYLAADYLMECAELGIDVRFINNSHHRKLAIIDRGILWEGSLNILSHVKSTEVMRRFNDKHEAKKMLAFLNLNKIL